ncbi:hypothetical protein QE390_001033 [Siphonobacter sp. SORGH_AS 1065]|nr:hypothetical protein [Siphonobacter sp. SORGH_AS_1065]
MNKLPIIQIDFMKATNDQWSLTIRVSTTFYGF